MVILGIDPGSRITGYAILVAQSADRWHCQEGGAIVLRQSSYPARLAALAQTLQTIMLQYQPQVLAIEKVFVRLNPASALQLGQARAIPLMLAGQYHIPVAEYAPCTIKKVVTGHGQASKEQVAYVLRQLLRLQGEAVLDATDALAVALCHGLQAQEPA